MALKKNKKRETIADFNTKEVPNPEKKTKAPVSLKSEEAPPKEVVKSEKKVEALPKAKPKPKETTLPKAVKNIQQAGIMRALKTRGYAHILPFKFIKGHETIIIHTDKATLEGTDISVPLGKGAITELMKQIKALQNK